MSLHLSAFLSLAWSFLKLPKVQTWFQESKTLQGTISRNHTHSAWAEFQHWSHSLFMVTQCWLWRCPNSSGTWLYYWALSPEHKHSTLVILVPLWKCSCPAVSFLVSQKILLFHGMAPFGFGLFIADACVSCCNQEEIKIKQACKHGYSSFFFFPF